MRKGVRKLSENSINMTIDHNLKILPEYYIAVSDGSKTFEIRKNDRDFHLGDIVMLQEYDESGFRGRNILVEIVYITDFEQKDNYVVLGIRTIFQVSGMF